MQLLTITTNPIEKIFYWVCIAGKLLFYENGGECAQSGYKLHNLHKRGARLHKLYKKETDILTPHTHTITKQS